MFFLLPGIANQDSRSLLIPVVENVPLFLFNKRNNSGTRIPT